MKVATHNGVFHADDVFACACLRLALGEVEVLRSRDLSVLDNADVVFDVGGEYAPERGRYDHHQRGGAGGREDGTPYAAFGLGWKAYGRNSIRVLTNEDEERILQLVDERLVRHIDAADCGYGEAPRGYSISQAISSLNPTWDSGGDFDEAFESATKVAEAILKAEIARAAGEIKAESIVLNAIRGASDPRVVVLEKFCPWQNILPSASSEALFVVFPSESNTFMVQAVPPEAGSFGKRKPLPEPWGGLRDEEFSSLTGVEDGVFCHPGLFIAGARSLQGAMTLASLALAE
jgi:uncharacterized UPF0160 family protein